MKITVIAADSYNHVHAAGCRDLSRYPHGREATFEAADQRGVVLLYYPPDCFDYDAADWADQDTSVKFQPCVAALPPEDDRT